MQHAIPTTACSAFCATCPDPAAIATLLGKLGLSLTFQMPTCTFRVAPPLPAQYHFASTQAEVLYLAGQDAPENPLARRFPAHQSRFFAFPGRDLAAYQLVLLTLFSEYGLVWEPEDAPESPSKATSRRRTSSSTLSRTSDANAPGTSHASFAAM